ncbi:MAG: hypothetical protein AAF747_08080 [Planctomycetota bacterium]
MNLRDVVARLGASGVLACGVGHALAQTPVVRDYEAVAISGEFEPGLGPDLTLASVLVSSLADRQVQVNQAGAVGFAAQLAGPGVTPENDTALIVFDVNGNASIVAREGDAVGDPSEGRRLMELSRLQSPRLEADGPIVFFGASADEQGLDEREGLFRAGAAGIVELLAVGQTPPGFGETATLRFRRAAILS